MQKQQWKWISGIAILLPLSVYPAQREWKLNHLLQGGENARSSRPWRDEAGRLAYFARKRRFADLWLLRHKKNVQPTVEAYLKDPSLGLRVSAVRALGWLEQPQGLKALKMMEKRVKSGQEMQMRLQTVQLAQGHIASRDLRGQKKLDVFCRSVGLSWGEVVRLSRKVNTPATPKDRYAVAGSPAVEIVRETVDLLYSMGKKKQDIAPFARQLALTPAQELYLQVAPLSTRQEITKLIEVAILKKPAGDTSGFEELIKNHVVGLGSFSQHRLLSLVEQVGVAPDKFFPSPEITRGYTTLFRAVANIGDQKALRPLKKLEKHHYRWVSYYAYQSRHKLEEKTAAPDFPA